MDVVRRSPLNGELSQHPPHPRRELVTRTTPPHSGEDIIHPRDGPDDEVIVADEVVEADIHAAGLGNVDYLRAAEARHAFGHEVFHARNPALGKDCIGRMLEAYLHAVRLPLIQRMPVDSEVQLCTHRQLPLGEEATHPCGGNEVLGLPGTVWPPRKADGAARQQPEYV